MTAAAFVMRSVRFSGSPASRLIASGALQTGQGREAGSSAESASQPLISNTSLQSGQLHCWYADHCAVEMPPGHRFPMLKYRLTRELLQSEPQTAQIAAFHPSPPAPLTDIQRVHTEEYVASFVRGTLSKAGMRAIGFPWSEAIVARNLASVGGTLAATRALLQVPELRMTAHISDVHQGNGTAAIFEGDDRVTTFDCFCHQNYPWKSRTHSTHNIAFDEACEDAEYLQTLRSWLPKLLEWQPELIFYQAGVDALHADSLGKMQLSRDALNARNNMVYSFALLNEIPMVITMGGGYAKPDISPSVAAHADVYRTAALRLQAVLASK